MENKITINGNQFEFEPGETILEIARRNGIYIPTLCFLEGAYPTGACRMCVVEVKMVRGLIAACSTPALNDMEVLTDTPDIIKARKLVIELLLISGNHNCAVRGNYPSEWTDFQQEAEEYDKAEEICVAYGRCKLQALAYKYMVSERRLDRIPTEYPLEYDNPLVGRDFSRCILCGRCVQACCDIQVNNALSNGYRGNVAKIVVRGDLTLSDSDCVYCGECIQVCPTGALFEKKNRYNARMWDVAHVRTTCYYCGIGCQLDLHIKDNQIVKIKGVDNAEPNKGRLCFKGRFAFDFIHSDQRLTKPRIRKDGSLTEVSWAEALELIATKLKETKEKHGPDSIGCMVSTKYTNEDLYQIKKFFKTSLTSENIFHFEPAASIEIEYEEFKKASTIVLVGSDLTHDNPVAASFVKQAVLSGVKLIVVDSRKTELSGFARIHLNDLAGLESELEGDTILLHDPEVDVSSLNKLSGVKIYSLGKENNTLGAYVMGITPREDIDFSSFKFLYLMGDNLQSDAVDFLVIQDIFPGQNLERADVVLPAAVWVEYEGTYISCDYRINLIRKAVDSPGEAKPAWWIFRELAKKMGENWDSKNPKEIWEREIIPKDSSLQKINYDLLEEADGIIIAEKPPVPLSCPVKEAKGYLQINTHKKLCGFCKNMENVIEKRFK